MRHYAALVLVGLLGAVGSIAFAADQPVSGKQVDLHWSELAMFLAAGHIKVPLTDGAIVEGEAISFTPEEMVMLVAKSSDAKVHAKGRQSFPRASVKTIQLTRVKGAGGRVGFTLLGIAGGMAGAAAIAVHYDDSGGGAEAAGALALIVGGGVAGYFGGREFDRKTTMIRVLPD